MMSIRRCAMPLTDWRTRRFFGRPWQDLLFGAGEIVFLFSIVPLLFTHVRIPLFTGLATGLMLYSFAVAQASYKNWITLFLTSVTGTVWIVLGLHLNPLI